MRPMRLFVPIALAAALLVGCQRIEEVAPSHKTAYSLEKVAGSNLTRMTLEASEARRLAIQTAPVHEVRTANGVRKTIAYSALLYGTKGETWTYTSPQQFVYLRHNVVVDFIDGDTAFLTEGPPPGTAIVTVGAAELYGLETGFGK